MNSAKIAIIILNWNGLNDTRECLNSLNSLSKSQIKIIVVDNGSAINEAELLKKEFSYISIIRLDSNTGFTGGVNAGISYALQSNPKYILLLNNDVIVTNNFLKNLVQGIEKIRNAGIASPIIYDYLDRSKITFSGGKINWLFARPYHIKNKRKSYVDNFYITGCCMLIKTEIFKRTGLFDERFFAYFEDAAFSVQVKSIGYKCVCITNSKIFHKESKSLGKKSAKYNYLFSRNRILFFKHYTSSLYLIYFYPFITIKTFLVCGYFILIGQLELSYAYFKGFIDGISNCGGAPNI